MASILPLEPGPPLPDFAALRRSAAAFEQSHDEFVALLDWAEPALAMLREIRQACYAWDSGVIDFEDDVTFKPVYANYGTRIRCGMCWPCRAHALAPIEDGDDDTPLLWLEGGR